MSALRLVVGFAFLLTFCYPSRAITYYVANGGDDSGLGMSSDNPWNSVYRVNSGSFLPGDSILFKRGCIWREQLVPPSSGLNGKQITISAYGVGPKPIISGADSITTFTRWTKAKTAIWVAPVPKQPNLVFFSGLLGIQEKSAAYLEGSGQWAWTQGLLFVYQASGVPVNIEVTKRAYSLVLGQTGAGSFTTISEMDFRMVDQDAVHIVNTTGDIVTNSNISEAYQFGIFAIGVNGSAVNDLIISGNTVSLNGSSGIEMSFGHHHVVVKENQVFQNAYNPQNTGTFQFMAGIYLFSNSPEPTNDVVQDNISNNNGVIGGNESQGSGIWLDTLSYSTVQDNSSFGNAAHGIFLEKNTNSVMSGNHTFSNALASNSANLTCYASFGTAAVGNTISNNTSTDSNGIGLKLGAYEGGGQTLFANNTIEHNTIANSRIADVVIDSGADNDVAYGSGNVYLSNSFPPP